MTKMVRHETKTKTHIKNGAEHEHWLFYRHITGSCILNGKWHW